MPVYPMRTVISSLHVSPCHIHNQRDVNNMTIMDNELFDFAALKRVEKVESSLSMTEMINDEKFLIGKKGTCVIFDGSKILHRGGLINSGERIVLQIVFGPKINILKKIYNKIIRKIIAL